MLPPLIVGDCQPLEVFLVDSIPAHVECANISHTEFIMGSLQNGIRIGGFLLGWEGEVFDNIPLIVEPDPSLPIDVEMTGDNHGEGGQWYQTFEFTIKASGTLADISSIVYGDQKHVNELFAAIQKKYPSIASPSQVQVGQTIELTLDPSRTSVLKEIASGDAADSQIRYYFNGVKEITPGKSNSAVERIVELPGDAPTNTFIVKRGEQELTIPLGNKFVQYSYEQGDSFESTVKASYGTLSARAIQDFERQTRWAYDRWPPAKGETAEATISLSSSYEDDAFQVLNLTLPDAEANAKFQELLQKRALAGVFPIKQRSDGITYRITVIDSSVTARQVAKLLYNSDERYLEVADTAGVQLESKDPTKLAADFDVPLIGRSFDISVDFADENFVLRQQEGDGDVVKTTSLLNGTVVAENAAAEKSLNGMQRTVYYPNGYHRLVYKPDDALVSVFDFLYFTFHFGNVEDDEDRQAFIGSMLWNTLRDIPRSAGDVAEEITLSDTATGKYLEALVWHREDIGIGEMLLYRWWTINPCLALFTLVFGASAFFLVLVIIIRKIAAHRYAE